MEDKNQKEGGFTLTPASLSCMPCRCRRNIFHKEKKKTIHENGQTTIEEHLDTSSIGFGRGITPVVQPRTLTLDEKIERLETKIEEIKIKQINDIDAGFRKAISLDERLLKLEKEIEKLKNKYTLNTMD